MTVPHEIVAAPLEVFLAPLGETFPAVDEEPAGEWERLGASGPENIGDDGVSVAHPQTVEEWRGQSVQPVKAFRTEEGLVLTFTLHDLSPTNYARILNDAEITQTSPGVGTAGTDEFPLARGSFIGVFAVLARGVSPVDNTLKAQYQLPHARPGGEPTVVWQKGTPAGLAFELSALVDQDAATERERFGKLVIQTAEAT